MKAFCDSTADVCDSDSRAMVIPNSWRSYGGMKCVNGVAETLIVGESNEWIRRILNEPGLGRILVVGVAEKAARVALVGDQLAHLAIENEWQGIVLDGCVRDVHQLSAMSIGIWATGTWPRRGPREGEGKRGVKLSLCDVSVNPGDRIICDGDGVVVVPE